MNKKSLKRIKLCHHLFYTNYYVKIDVMSFLLEIKLLCIL